MIVTKKVLTLEDLDPTVRANVRKERYPEKPAIKGVKILELNLHIEEDGDFAEIFRIDKNGETKEFPGFKIAQMNRTKLNAGAIKAWHLHLAQDEVWYIMPRDSIFVGLWDVRKDSSTVGQAMRVVLGGALQMVFIPKGVAHGGANFIEHPVNIFYFVNEQFDKSNPDEHRIPWDALGKDFWTPKRD